MLYIHVVTVAISTDQYMEILVRTSAIFLFPSNMGALKPWALLALFSTLFLFRELSEASPNGTKELAMLPPRGWNSYDSFSWTVDEQAFLHNAEVMANKLLPYGYEYVVVDFLWFRKNVEGAKDLVHAIGFDQVDGWGRPCPDPERWPSSRGGEGFKEVARKVHNMGLKFGIHVMRGISAQAVNTNTPILDVFKGGAFVKDGHQWKAGDIAMEDMKCKWLEGFMSVNTYVEAGKAFLRSLYRQYAEWGVDFVKLDCVFGEDMNPREIITVSELLEELDHPVVFSLSPGTKVTPTMADIIYMHVNMYRITGDDWDTWEDVAAHFDVSRDFAAAKKIGAQGLNGRSWPDLDMLPLGWLTDAGVQQGPHRKCDLTLNEQKTQMTLWAMAKSPLMFGGDLRKLDDITYGLITNPTILEINSDSENNMEFPYVSVKNNLGRRNDDEVQKAASGEQQHISDINVLRLTSCSNENAKRWFISHKGEMTQICWKPKMKSSANISCLYKRMPLLTLDEEITYKQRYLGKFQLLAANTTDTCLVASVSRKQTSSESRSGLLSTCKWNDNQIWELNDNGNLVSSYSGLCAAIERKEAEPIVEGIRSWIATGTSGKVYLAFFNMYNKRTEISADIKDLAKVLGHEFATEGPCGCSEVWSGKKFLAKKTISMMVEPHGCSLFVLDCKSFISF